MAAVHRISPILARQGPNQLHMRVYHDLAGFVRRGVSFGGFSGEHGACERAQSVERPKGSLKGRFWPNPGFKNI